MEEEYKDIEQDESPADEMDSQGMEGDYGEHAMEEEEYPEEKYEEGYEEGEGYPEEDEMYGEHGMDEEMASGMGEVPEEKLGAQVLRELHMEAEQFLEKYDQIYGLLDHEHVSAHLMKLMERTVQDLEEIEAAFTEHYPEYESPGAKDIVGDEGEGEASSSDKLPTPSPDEVVEGMAQGTGQEEEGYEEEEPEQPLDEEERGQKSLEDGEKTYPKYTKEKFKERLDKAVKKGEQNVREGRGGRRLDKYVEADKKKKGLDMFYEYAEKTLGDVHQFMGTLGKAKFLNDELRMDSWHYAKSLNMIQNRIDKEFGETMAGKKKGSLLPSPHGVAGEGEPEEVDVNKPHGPTKYKPGTEPMQQFGKDGQSPHMKGSLLDHYDDTGDAGDALGHDKDTESHINEPHGPNAHVKPGEDKDAMAYGHDGEWPHKGKKGSLLPAPHGEAGEGEPEEVHVNKPSSNPQAKPGADKEHQWFGKPGEWPIHKKNMQEAEAYLLSIAKAKDFSLAMRDRASYFQKSFECFNTQLSAVGVTKASSNSQVKPGQDQEHQPFGKDGQWPQSGPSNGSSESIASETKNLDGYLTNREKRFEAMNDNIAKLAKLIG